MSEGINPLERTYHNIKGKYYEAIGLHPGSNPEWHRNIGSEKRAKQAVLNFLHSSSQEPLSTFFSDSQSIINLADYQQGTMIRVEQYFPLSATPDMPGYRWFVVGDRKGEDSVYIYGVTFEDKSSNGPTLPTSGKLLIFTPEPLKLTSFAVKDAIAVLAMYGDSENEKKTLELTPVSRVDIMALGKTKKLKQESYKPISRRQFVREPV